MASTFSCRQPWKWETFVSCRVWKLLTHHPVGFTVAEQFVSCHPCANIKHQVRLKSGALHLLSSLRQAKTSSNRQTTNAPRFLVLPATIHAVNHYVLSLSVSSTVVITLCLTLQHQQTNHHVPLSTPPASNSAFDPSTSSSQSSSSS